MHYFWLYLKWLGHLCIKRTCVLCSLTKQYHWYVIINPNANLGTEFLRWCSVTKWSFTELRVCVYIYWVQSKWVKHIKTTCSKLALWIRFAKYLEINGYIEECYTVQDFLGVEQIVCTFLCQASCFMLKILEHFSKVCIIWTLLVDGMRSGDVKKLNVARNLVGTRMLTHICWNADPAFFFIHSALIMGTLCFID